MNRTLEYARINNIPITAVQFRPYFNEKKGRVAKGEGIANKGWKDIPGFHHENQKYYGTNASAWYLLLSKANMYVVDVDTEGGMTAQEVLTEEAYNRLWEASSYVVETGSGGAHFYFQSNGVKLTKAIDVEQWRSWMRPGVKGGIDLITDYIVMEGSSYEFEGKTYTYKSVKPGATIASTTFHQGIFDEVSGVSKPKNVVVVPEESPLPAGIAPIMKEAYNLALRTADEVKLLVNLLSEERATGYDSWMKVGFLLKALFHDGSDGEELFLEFSKKSHKYNERDCLKAYRAISPRTGFTLKSLHRWAKEDSPAEYETAFGLKMTWGLLKCLNQSEMAKCFTGLVTQEYVFSQGVWFNYTPQNTLVRLGKTHPDGLKRLVSDCLQEEALSLVKSLTKDQDTYTACLKLASESHKTFGSSQWVNGVIDFIRGLYTDDDLYDLIDTDMNLLAFSNGLLCDYSTKAIRPIQREDNIMRTTGKPLTQESSKEKRLLLLTELLNIFNTPEMVNYWLETIAIALFRNSFEKIWGRVRCVSAC